MHDEWTSAQELPTIPRRPSTGSSRTPAAKAPWRVRCGARVGGGCVVLLIEPDARERVEKAVAESGGELLPMQIDRQGVTVVTVVL